MNKPAMNRAFSAGAFGCHKILRRYPRLEVTMLRLWRAKEVWRVAPTTRTDHGAGVTAFPEGVALGSCLPDSIIVGRIAPIGSGFVVP